MNYFKSIILALPLFLGVNSFAQQSEITPEIRTVENPSEYVPHIGISVGIGEPEGSLDAGGNYALEIGFQPIIPFGLAAELSFADYNNGGTDLERASLLLKGSYNFGGDIPILRHSYVGLGLGIVNERFAGDTDLELGLMPNAGADIPIRGFTDEPLTVGFNVSHMYLTSNAPDVFAINAVVKYWY